MNKSFSGNPPLQFPPVFFARYRVNKLSGGQIDELLANGWFRNDLHVYTTVGRYVENSWRPCVMLRIPLEDFAFKKRLKKILRRNGRKFSVEVKPFEPREEVDALWSRFKKEIHGWSMVPKFSFHLFRGVSPGHFNSWEMSVYDGDKLVAFSVFDRGEISLASMEAAYDPGYARYSLGLYTMLLEIELGIKEKYCYFYPGFLPKDVSMFSYKLRTGNVEFFRARSTEWLPVDRLEKNDWLLLEVLKKLNSIKKNFSGRGLYTSVVVAGGTNFPGFVPKASDYNIYLLVENRGRVKAYEKVSLKMAWDPFEQKFYLFQHNEQQVSTAKSGNALPFGTPELYSFAGEFDADPEMLSFVKTTYPNLKPFLPDSL